MQGGGRVTPFVHCFITSCPSANCSRPCNNPASSGSTQPNPGAIPTPLLRKPATYLLLPGLGASQSLLSGILKDTRAACTAWHPGDAARSSEQRRLWPARDASWWTGTFCLLWPGHTSEKFPLGSTGGALGSHRRAGLKNTPVFFPFPCLLSLHSWDLTAK